MKSSTTAAVRQDFRSSIVMTGFVVLIASLGLAASFSAENAQTNKPLMSAVFGQTN